MGSKAVLSATLSYFIEPNPSNRDFARRYVYENVGLRFSFKRKGETSDDFKARVSKEQETAESQLLIDAERSKDIKRAPADDRWRLGPDLRGRGSLHSDRWVGEAHDLAGMDQVAIYPVSGWWRYTADTTPHGRRVPYSLAISVTIQGQPEAQLYAEVEQLVAQSNRERISVDVG